MARPTGKAEQTRQYIIAQTAPIFNRQGYAATSMKDLTQATGLTKGAIYGNFKDKDEVSLAAFAYNLEQLTSHLRRAAATGTTAGEQLKAIVNFYRNVHNVKFLEAGCPLMNTAVESDDMHPALRQAVQTAIEEWQDWLAGIMKAGQEQGQINPDANPFQYAALFMSLIEGATMLAKATNKPYYMLTPLNHMDKVIEQDLILT